MAEIVVHLEVHVRVTVPNVEDTNTAVALAIKEAQARIKPVWWSVAAVTRDER